MSFAPLCKESSRFLSFFSMIFIVNMKKMEINCRKPKSFRVCSWIDLLSLGERRLTVYMCYYREVCTYDPRYEWRLILGAAVKRLFPSRLRGFEHKPSFRYSVNDLLGKVTPFRSEFIELNRLSYLKKHLTVWLKDTPSRQRCLWV